MSNSTYRGSAQYLFTMVHCAEWALRHRREMHLGEKNLLSCCERDTTEKSPLYSATQLLCTLTKTDGIKKEKLQILLTTLISSVSLWGMRSSLPISFLRVYMEYGAIAGR